MEYIYKLDAQYIQWNKLSSRLKFYYPAILNIKDGDMVYFLIDANSGEPTCLLAETIKTNMKGINIYNETLEYLDRSLMMSLEQKYIEFIVVKKSFHQDLNIYSLQKKGFIFESSNMIKRIGKHVVFFQEIETKMAEDINVNSYVFPIEKEILSYDRQKQEPLFSTISLFIKGFEDMTLLDYKNYAQTSLEVGMMTNLYYDDLNDVWYSKKETIDLPEIYLKMLKDALVNKKHISSLLWDLALAIKHNTLDLYIFNPETLIKMAIYLEIPDPKFSSLYHLNLEVYKALIHILPNFQTYDKKAFSRSIHEWSKTIQLNVIQTQMMTKIIELYDLKKPKSPFVKRDNNRLLNDNFELQASYVLKNNRFLYVTLPFAFQPNFFLDQMMCHFNISSEDCYYTNIEELIEKSNRIPYKLFFGLKTIQVNETSNYIFRDNVFMIYILEKNKEHIVPLIGYNVDLVLYQSELTKDMLKIQLKNYALTDADHNQLIDLFNTFNKSLSIDFQLPTYYYYNYPWGNGLTFNENFKMIKQRRLDPLKENIKEQLLKEGIYEN